MQFSYRARTRDGKILAGVVEASDRNAVVDSLAKQGARPLVVQEIGAGRGGTSTKKGRGFFKPKVKSRDLVIFTRQLSTMISAGVPLPRSLSTLGEQAENEYFKQIISAIGRDIESGQSLGDAFGKHPDVFSEVYISMIRAGEAGGILDDILKRLAVQTEKDATIRKKIKSAMTYPTVILAVTVVAFFGLMVFVIPKIGAIITDVGGPDAKLPIYTQILLDTTNFTLSSSLIPGVPNMVFVVGGLIAVIYFLLRYIRTPAGKYKFHGLLLRIPVIKTVVVKVAISRFSRTFASLATAGVAVLDALAVTGNAIGNRVIQEELATAAREVQNGKPLSTALASAKHFPPIVPQMLAVGEETGQIDTVLIKVADFYDEEVDTLIEGLSSIIEPVMIIVLGSAVGLIAASVMGPISSISQNLSG